MNRFANMLSKITQALSRPARRCRPRLRIVLQLESLDGRIMPSFMPVASVPMSPPNAIYGTTPPVIVSTANHITSAPLYYPSANQLLGLHGYLQLSMGDQMTITSITLNSDGTASFQGNYYFSGTPITQPGFAVSGTIGTFQRGGPLGYSANISFHGTDMNTGENIEYQGLLFMNSQHATTSGTLYDCFVDGDGHCTMRLPPASVTGTFY
jgi:hypothetical protein